MPQVLLRQSGAALLTASKAAVIAGLPAPPSKHSLPGHFISARARLVAGGVVADVLVIRLVAAEALMLAATRSGFLLFQWRQRRVKVGSRGVAVVVTGEGCRLYDISNDVCAGNRRASGNK